MTVYSAGVFGLLLLSACGPKNTTLTPSPTEKAIENIPEWFLSPPNDSSHLFATATATSTDMQLSLRKAQTSAQTDISQQLENRLGNLTKSFQEEIGSDEGTEMLQQFTSATKAVTDQTLTGARVDQRKILPEEGIYRAYVLMSLPIGEANNLLMKKIKANESLYTRFRSTKAFEELNKELEALKE